MKMILLRLSFLFFWSLSITTWADRILITGKPVALVPNADYYNLPPGYTTIMTGMHYVTIGGVNRVCFRDRQPRLASLDMLLITIEVDKAQYQWSCYAFDPAFFEIDF